MLKRYCDLCGEVMEYDFSTQAIIIQQAQPETSGKRYGIEVRVGEVIPTMPPSLNPADVCYECAMKIALASENPYIQAALRPVC